MCGIFGIMNHDVNAVVDRRLLERSCSLLAHRGPDHKDLYADGPVGLAHTRLSLLDLSDRSHQPFWDPDGRYCLVYNGEIYNFMELRGDLEKRGVPFHTTSDTEVLLAGLIHDGAEATVAKLEGMFAFALYDTERRELLLARDRFGIKPLYVVETPSAFLFSSEIAAFRPWLPLEPDMLTIAEYLRGFPGPSKGFTFYKDIRIASPGTIIRIRQGGTSESRRFFAMCDLWDDDQFEQFDRLSPCQIVDHVEEQLLESVRMQLVADVPVGALCSGGVDSSVIMAMAARFHTNLAVFHANVVGPNSEYTAARQLADHLKLDLQVTDVRDEDFIQQMPDVTLHYGHPFFRHPNSVPFIMVSRLVAAHHIKAVLSGEGADECYYGYPNMIFNLGGFLNNLSHQPPTQTVRQFLRWCMGRQKKQASLLPDAGLGSRYERELESEDIRRTIEARCRRRPKERELISLDMLSYHLRTLLHRNDCLGMSAGIEARFPFLHSPLVKTAVNLPYRFKVRFSPRVFVKQHYFLRDKWVLRQIAGRYLPPGLAHRQKLGFPADAYFRMNIPSAFFEKSLTCEMLGLGRRELEYLFGHCDQTYRARLLHLEVWAHMCLYGMSKEAILERLNTHITINSI